MLLHLWRIPTRLLVQPPITQHPPPRMLSGAPLPLWAAPGPVQCMLWVQAWMRALTLVLVSQVALVLAPGQGHRWAPVQVSKVALVLALEQGRRWAYRVQVS